jgi:hypothetical protein
MADETRQECRERWVNYAREQLVGRTITNAFMMSQDDCDAMDWGSSGLMLELDNGTVIYPVRDDEGNGPGTLRGVTKDGEQLVFPVV